MKSKTGIFKLVVIFLILGLLGVVLVWGMGVAKTYLAGATAGCEPSANSMKVQAEDKSALISWKTAKECLAVVEYGTNPTATLLRAVETGAGAVHQITLSPLKPEMIYYFRVRVGEDEYVNGTIPWSFKTKASSSLGEEAAALEEPIPTVALPPAGSLSECIRADFLKYFGTDTPAYDLNGDGVVDQKDWVECLKKFGTGSEELGVSPTPVEVGGDLCDRIKAGLGGSDEELDLNNDGVVNTADWIECQKS